MKLVSSVSLDDLKFLSTSNASRDDSCTSDQKSRRRSDISNLRSKRRLLQYRMLSLEKRRSAVRHKDIDLRRRQLRVQQKLHAIMRDEDEEDIPEADNVDSVYRYFSREHNLYAKTSKRNLASLIDECLHTDGLFPDSRQDVLPTCTNGDTPPRKPCSLGDSKNASCYSTSDDKTVLPTQNTAGKQTSRYKNLKRRVLSKLRCFSK